MRIKLGNRYFRSSDEGLACLVTLRSQAEGPDLASVQTNRYGDANLPLTGVNDGEYWLIVEKPDEAFWPADSQVGPDLKPDDGIDRVWRPFRCTLRVVRERIASTGHTDATVSGNTLNVGLLPVWIRSAASTPRSDDPTLVIIHRTNTAITSALLGQAAGRSDRSKYISHYGITPEGNVVKFVTEDRKCSHAGGTWQGNSANAQSIGIELISAGRYPDVQMAALERLLVSFVAKYPIDAIIGHNDVEFKKRDFDPGPNFDWPRIERLLRGWADGMIPQGSTDAISSGFRQRTAYGGFFELEPGGRLKLNDNDRQHKYGGRVRNIPTDVIGELTSDLRHLGYSCSDRSTFGATTQLVVKALQHHFFSGTRYRTYRQGEVDWATADMIKAVVWHWAG